MEEQEASNLLSGSAGWCPSDTDILSGSITDNFGYVEARKKELLAKQDKE